MIRRAELRRRDAMTLMAFDIPDAYSDKALDFGPVGEITTPPEDQLSRDIMRDFAGPRFQSRQQRSRGARQPHDWKPGATSSCLTGSA